MADAVIDLNAHMTDRKRAQSGAGGDAQLFAFPGVNLQTVAARTGNELKQPAEEATEPCYPEAVHNNLKKYMRSINEMLVQLKRWNWPHSAFEQRLHELSPEVAQLHSDCPDQPNPFVAYPNSQHYFLLARSRVKFIDECVAKVERLAKDLQAAEDCVVCMRDLETFLDVHEPNLVPRKLFDSGRFDSGMIREVALFAIDPKLQFARCRKLVAEASQALRDQRVDIASDLLANAREVRSWHRRSVEYKQKALVFELIEK